MKKKVFPSYRPIIEPGFFHKQIKDYHLIIHSTKPSWVLINDFSWQIVQLLNGNNSVSDIVQLLKSEYDVEEHVLRKDINEFIESLLRSGILEDHQDGKGKTDFIFSDIFLHITNKCNLNCRHCYYPDNKTKEVSELTDSEILDLLEKFYDAGGRGVTLSGGEPLLRNDLVKTILKKSRKSTVKILTNGTLINDDFADFLKDFNVLVQVSIDGSTEEIHESIRGKGSFRSALRGIKALKGKGLAERTNFCTTLTRQNISDIGGIINLTQSFEIPFVRFIPLRKEGRACRSWPELNSGLSIKDSEEFYDYIFEKAKKEYPNIEITSGLCGFVLDPKKLDNYGRWCPVGRMLIIDTKGDTYPCVMFMDEQYKLGNIRTDSMDDFKNSPVLSKLVNDLTDREEKILKCRSCMWKNFCQAGCAGLALERYKTIWKSDECCHYRKNLYEKAFVKIVEGKALFYSQGEESECI